MNKILSLVILFAGVWTSFRFSEGAWVAYKANLFEESQNSTFERLFVHNSATMVMLWIFSFCFSNLTFMDLYWSLFTLYVVDDAVLQRWSNAEDLKEVLSTNLRVLVPLVILHIWGLRLALVFLRDWKGFPHMDERYKIVERQCKLRIVWWPKSFAMFALSQIVIMQFAHNTIVQYLGTVDVLSSGSNRFTALEFIGTALLFVSQVYESEGDRELHAFRHRPAAEKKSPVIDEGLWRYSRHPNYFGEILFWWAQYVFTLATHFTYPVGAVLITLMFAGGSVKLMEDRLVNRPGYAEYKNRVISPLVPFCRLGK